MSDQQQFAIPTPPQEAFASHNPNTPLQGEEIISYISTKMEHVPYEGIIVHIQGATHPKRGFPTPEAVHINNIIKTLIKESLSHKYLLLLSLLTSKQSLFVSFNTLHRKAFTPYLLKEEYLSPASYSLHLLIYNLLTKIRINPGTAKTTALAIGNVLEYEDAYRYRLQDISDETTYYRLSTNPYKELTRLFHIFQERDQTSTTAMDLTKLLRPFLFLLRIPFIRNIFLSSINNNIINGLKYTPMDKYWAQLKGDNYLFTGRTYEERTKDLVIPQAYRIT